MVWSENCSKIIAINRECKGFMLYFCCATPQKWLKFMMSPRKWPIPRKQKFFRDGSSGKVVAPSVLVICPVDKNRGSNTKNWLLAPKIQILGSKVHIFIPSGPLEPRRSIFSTQKRCLIGCLIWWYQMLFSRPWKLGFSAQKLPNLTKTGHFWSL